MIKVPICSLDKLIKIDQKMAINDHSKLPKILILPDSLTEGPDNL